MQGQCSGCQAGEMPTLLPTLPSLIYISGRVFHKEGDKQGQCSGCQVGGGVHAPAHAPLTDLYIR